jgi:hypothetical protein
MSDENRDIDALLRHNAEQQLEGFDWDRLGARISSRLGRTTSPAIFHRRAMLVRMASAAVVVAAIVLLIVVFYGWLVPDKSPSILEQIATGTLHAGALGPALGETDSLIADTSPRTILLAGQTHLICSDPLLRPHSVWDQEPMPASADIRVKEK